TVLSQVVAGRYSPSKRLIESVAKSLGESPVWILLDEQRVAFNMVLGLVEKTTRTGEKAAVVIVGRPGTGKSVIAVHLLVSLSQSNGYRVCHATGSEAFTLNFRALCPMRVCWLVTALQNFQ